MKITASIMKVFLIIIFLALSAAPCFADQALKEKVDAYLKPLLDEDLISGSVLVARGDDILLAQGYGAANREYDIPNTADTKFRLGSMSKQFTAAAIMLLAERGRLSVDDPISRFYPDYPKGDSITLHHLLTHTSGIPNFTTADTGLGIYIYPHKIDDVIGTFKNLPLQFQPGEKWAYTNSGYTLLAGVVEKVSGVPFAAFLQDNIFGPLGMNSTGQDSYTAIIKNRADGYLSFGFDVNRVDYRDMPTMAGAGALYSTPKDMYLWDRALYTDKLLSKASRDIMFTAFISNYGYGWFIEDRNGHRAISHRGEISGFIGSIDRYPDDSIVVIALFNFESTFARAAIRGLNEIALGREPKPLLVDESAPVDPAVLSTYIGTYRFDEKDTLQVTSEGDKLYVLGITAKNRLPALPQTPHVFFVRGLNALVRFDPPVNGKVDSLILVNSVQVYKARRISP